MSYIKYSECAAESINYAALAAASEVDALDRDAGIMPFLGLCIPAQLVVLIPNEKMSADAVAAPTTRREGAY